jgi:hypothetical protein
MLDGGRRRPEICLVGVEINTAHTMDQQQSVSLCVHP